jgi:hypothetical protein
LSIGSRAIDPGSAQQAPPRHTDIRNQGNHVADIADEESVGGHPQELAEKDSAKVWWDEVDDVIADDALECPCCEGKSEPACKHDRNAAGPCSLDRRGDEVHADHLSGDKSNTLEDAARPAADLQDPVGG